LFISPCNQPVGVEAYNIDIEEGEGAEGPCAVLGKSFDSSLRPTLVTRCMLTYIEDRLTEFTTADITRGYVSSDTIFDLDTRVIIRNAAVAAQPRLTATVVAASSTNAVAPAGSSSLLLPSSNQRESPPLFADTSSAAGSGPLATAAALYKKRAPSVLLDTDTETSAAQSSNKLPPRHPLSPSLVPYNASLNSARSRSPSPQPPAATNKQEMEVRAKPTTPPKQDAPASMFNFASPPVKQPPPPQQQPTSFDSTPAGSVPSPVQIPKPVPGPAVPTTGLASTATVSLPVPAPTVLPAVVPVTAPPVPLPPPVMAVAPSPQRPDTARIVEQERMKALREEEERAAIRKQQELAHKEAEREQFVESKYRVVGASLVSHLNKLQLLKCWGYWDAEVRRKKEKYAKIMVAITFSSWKRAFHRRKAKKQALIGEIRALEAVTPRRPYLPAGGVHKRPHPETQLELLRKTSRNVLPAMQELILRNKNAGGSASLARSYVDPLPLASALKILCEHSILLRQRASVPCIAGPALFLKQSAAVKHYFCGNGSKTGFQDGGTLQGPSWGQSLFLKIGLVTRLQSPVWATHSGVSLFENIFRTMFSSDNNRQDRPSHVLGEFHESVNVFSKRNGSATIRDVNISIVDCIGDDVAPETRLRGLQCAFILVPSPDCHPDSEYLEGALQTLVKAIQYSLPVVFIVCQDGVLGHKLTSLHEIAQMKAMAAFLRKDELLSSPNDNIAVAAITNLIAASGLGHRGIDFAAVVGSVPCGAFLLSSTEVSTASIPVQHNTVAGSLVDVCVHVLQHAITFVASEAAPLPLLRRVDVFAWIKDVCVENAWKHCSEDFYTRSNQPSSANDSWLSLLRTVCGFINSSLDKCGQLLEHKQQSNLSNTVEFPAEEFAADGCNVFRILFDNDVEYNTSSGNNFVPVNWQRLNEQAFTKCLRSIESFFRIPTVGSGEFRTTVDYLNALAQQGWDTSKLSTFMLNSDMLSVPINQQRNPTFHRMCVERMCRVVIQMWTSRVDAVLDDEQSGLDTNNRVLYIIDNSYGSSLEVLAQHAGEANDFGRPVHSPLSMKRKSVTSSSSQYLDDAVPAGLASHDRRKSSPTLPKKARLTGEPQSTSVNVIPSAEAHFRVAKETAVSTDDKYAEDADAMVLSTEIEYERKQQDSLQQLLLNALHSGGSHNHKNASNLLDNDLISTTMIADRLIANSEEALANNIVEDDGEFFVVKSSNASDVMKLIELIQTEREMAQRR
jgi:hypothetical protein